MYAECWRARRDPRLVVMCSICLVATIVCDCKDAEPLAQWERRQANLLLAKL